NSSIDQCHFGRCRFSLSGVFSLCILEALQVSKELVFDSGFMAICFRQATSGGAEQRNTCLYFGSIALESQQGDKPWRVNIDYSAKLIFDGGSTVVGKIAHNNRERS